MRGNSQEMVTYMKRNVFSLVFMYAHMSAPFIAYISRLVEDNIIKKFNVESTNFDLTHFGDMALMVFLIEFGH